MFGVTGLGSLLSLFSFESIECVGDRGPEAMLLGESFKGESDLFRSESAQVMK